MSKLTKNEEAAHTLRVATFYKALRKQLKISGITQKQLCAKVGVDGSYFNSMKDLGCLPRLYICARIDKFLEGDGYWSLLAGHLPYSWDPKQLHTAMKEFGMIGPI